MGEQSVVADRDAEAAEQVGADEDADVDPVDGLFQSSATAAIKPRKGTTTPITLPIRSMVDIPVPWVCAEAEAEAVAVVMS